MHLLIILSSPVMFRLLINYKKYIRSYKDLMIFVKRHIDALFNQQLMTDPKRVV